MINNGVQREAERAERGAAILDKQSATASAVLPHDEEKAAAGQGPSQADMLVALAQELFEFAKTEADETFAMRRGGPRIALMFRGSQDAMRPLLASEFRRRHRRIPSSAALAAAMDVLQGEAFDAVRRDVHLRVAEYNGGIVLDLGRADGKVVRITATGWQVLDRSPVIFRRTALSGELPLPEQGGHLDMLRDLLHAEHETWLMLLSWLVAGYLPQIPHPILMLGGEHGSGKTTTARTLVSLLDPSPAPVRSQPRDPDQWAISAGGSWAVVVDNISRITDWWSDALCKAVTGDGLVRRKLYTDHGLVVLKFKRAIVLTSIDPGALRGDLGDRIVLVDLQPIAPGSRRAEQELEVQLQATRARALGAVLDLVANVLRELPNVELTEMPRMADFARVLAAMDRVLGTHALDLYLGQRGRVAQEVLDADPVAEAITSLGEFTGTMGKLLEQITPPVKPKSWPRSARALGAHLRRLMPAFRQAGLQVNIGVRGRDGVPVSIS